MNRSVYIASCALVFIGLFAVGLWFYRPRIEADLTLRATEALRKESLVAKSVRFEGRDGFIEMSGSDARAAREKVSRVYGVRVVKVRSEAPKVTAAPWVRLSRVGEAIRLSGAVANEERRSALDTEVRSLFEGFKVVSAWESEGAVSDPPYLSELGGLIRLLVSVGPEGKLALEKGQVLLAGEVASEASRQEIMAAAKAATPKGLELFLDLRAPVVEAPRKVAQAIPSSRLLFEFDSTQLTQESAAQAASLVEAIKATSSPLRIVGHTDSIGTEEYNQQLSLRRANKVRELFQSKGIPSLAQGLGETSPVATNQTTEGRAQNRRVEFEVIEGG